jgi:hypothetical protein
MSDTNQAETFTERVDVTTQPDGAFIGRLEIGTVSGSHPREDADALRAEVLTLRQRVRELEETRPEQAVIVTQPLAWEAERTSADSLAQWRNRKTRAGSAGSSSPRVCYSSRWEQRPWCSPYSRVRLERASSEEPGARS